MALLSRLAEALRRDTVGGFLLIGAAAIALAWANSPWGPAYEALRSFTFGPEALHLHLSLEAWVADGLLALFFFIVGNELKQEFVHGDLRNPRRAMLPITAAICGVIVPATIFIVFTWGNSGVSQGWGIPIATDIAFAVAILAVIGRHLPSELRTFLLTLAIVDDLIAIIVIALFYTDDLSVTHLVGALLLLGLFVWLQRGTGPVAGALARAGATSAVVWVPLALLIWVLMHESGVHATIAGAAMGLAMRTHAKKDEESSPSARMEHLLRPWAMGFALPVFALLAAGVAFSDPAGIVTDPIALGIIFGLVLGKLVGIAGGSWLITKLTPAELSPSLRWIDIVGMSQLAGIGFTVSILISELSYAGDPVLLEHAKSAVLIASAVAAVTATVTLGARNVHYRSLARPAGASDADTAQESRG